MPRGQPQIAHRGRGRDHGRGRGRGAGNDRSHTTDKSTDFNVSQEQQIAQIEQWNTGEMNAHLPERIRDRNPDSLDSDSNASGNSAIVLNVDIRRYVHQQETIVAGAQDGDWLKMPEVPTNQEVALLDDEEVALPANKVRGKWKSIDRYLKAHFALLREDAISPLRDAVDKFKESPEMTDNQEVSIYEKVHIIGFTFSHTGIAARIQFSTRRAQRRILWQGSKRLVSGGLVALTPVDDNFQSKCVVAVVAARPLEGVLQNPPEIDLFFIRAEDIEIDAQQEWIMVEARAGYYEAYRHTLRALQKLNNESFPLSEHICSMSTNIPPPAYLQANPVIDLSSAGRVDSQIGYGQVDVIKNWPGPKESNLDMTQWESLHQILTKSLAVVQGPPGTGKTYVSTVALEILNRNTKPGDPPIIIVAHTNHALDQLLGHVSQFEPQYVRLGGRSTNGEVKKHALYEIRKRERINLIPGSLLRKASSNIHIQAKAMLKILESLHLDQTKPPSIETLVQIGVISSKQGQSIAAGSSRWISARSATIHPVEFWLSGSLIPFVVERDAEDFGFDDEDEDLEVEQLREHEAEHGINDEEDAQDMLQGSWCSVNYRLGVATPSETDIKKATKELDTTENLWNIPDGMRGPVFYVIMQRLKAILLERLREKAAIYNENLKDLRIGKWERDAVFLQRAKIIGLTTTGLSKYRPLIASLKPRIILIEEAAEVLEAPVTVACMESVQQLILIGDHEQLQGHCSVRELESEPFHLNVSLFERLVRNKMLHTTLLTQRRMHPDFRKLLAPIYPLLKDHPSVELRPRRDWGMGDVRGFFFDHKWHESRDGQMSTYNAQEAEFVAGFYRWLVLNGIPPSEITLLTLYNGHRKRLLKEIRALPELKQVYNNVKTVDSYQGEENTIVLLSLARHNLDNKIGFLENRNRVCVALSRAKEGFYIFGSTTVLANDPLWMTVTNRLKAQGRLGRSLPVVCKQHKNRLLVQNPDDWKAKLGGCDEKCLQVLKCSHVCVLKCHPFSHETVFCAIHCRKELRCGHVCQRRCYQECFCDCEAFQQAAGRQRPSKDHFTPSAARSEQESCHEPRLLDTSEIDIFVDGCYLSGQSSSYAGSRMNLPNQASKWNHQFETHAGLVTRARPGIQGLGSRESGGETWSSARTHKRASSFAASRFSGAEQEQSLTKWSGFANGGVQNDDYERSLDNPPTSFDQASSRSLKLQPGQQFDGQIVRNQRSLALNDGRQKFSEDYVPAAFRAATQGWDGRATDEMAREDPKDGAGKARVDGAKIDLLIDLD